MEANMSKLSWSNQTEQVHDQINHKREQLNLEGRLVKAIFSSLKVPQVEPSFPVIQKSIYFWKAV